MKDDSVSRAAVLNLIEQSCCDLEYDCDNVALRKEVEALPPAQPSVSKEEMVGDAVSRQGVLRLLNAVPSEEFATKAMLIGGVNALPSAQLAQDLTKGCTDTISRQAVLNLIEQSCCDLEYACDNVALRKEVEALPSAQPGWIPCSTALPKDEEEVIVSIHDDSGDCAWDYTSSGWYAAAGEFWVVDNEASMRVVAWMPLPTPYREGGQS